jgi:hypothetical protein
MGEEEDEGNECDAEEYESLSVSGSGRYES